MEKALTHAANATDLLRQAQNIHRAVVRGERKESECVQEIVELIRKAVNESEASLRRFDLIRNSS